MRHPAAITLLILASTLIAAASAVADDIGPNTPNGAVDLTDIDTAGQPIALAGSTSTLYLATLNAGVWKSVSNGPWVQLPNSPSRAYSIAVDPNDATHLAVGERDGDAVDIHLNGAGLWESRDAGNTWSYTFDPLSLTGCPSQAIPSLAFSRNGTLFIAGPCGIGRRQSGQTAFDFSRTPPDLGLVTAIVPSETKMWARTEFKLLISTDDGLNWAVKDMPSDIGGLAVTFPSRGDVFSLAAFDSGAYMTGIYDPTPPCGNLNRILIYNAATDSWTLQPRFDSNGNQALGCDGTGLGGRRFSKAFILNRPDLQALIGQRLQLFAGVGQEVYQADSSNSDGTITHWTRTAATYFDGPQPDPIHADLWDFHLSPDATRAWVANDGGVNTKAWPLGGWVTFNENLFTHYINTLTVLLTGSPSGPRFAYPTPDNDAWFYDNLTGGWQTLGGLGDASWTAGDAGNPKIALMWRRPGLAVMTGFSDPLPNGQTYQYGIVLNNDETFDGPLFLQFIQTLKDESPTYPLIDAVMLVKLPLMARDSTGNLTPVPGPLGQPNPGGGPVLIRNRQFASSPDANASRFQTWEIAANDLPAETRGFWVAGGHANPTYYTYATFPSGASFLYKRSPNATGWSLLNVSGLLPGSTYGPAFVNPYNPDRIFVLTDSGVKVSTDGGLNFALDLNLTAFLTDSGKFPLTGTFNGGNSNYVIIASRAGMMGTLSHVAFSRDNPSAMVAASPFTGVFHNSGDGVWRNLTGFLARPFTAVSAVGIDDQAIYVATEGRGLQRIPIGLCGDVNGDRVINIGDALVVAQYTVGLRQCGVAPFTKPAVCDINLDDACNIGDALRMAQCDVGLISCAFNCRPFTCP